MSELEFGFEEVRLEPVQGRLIEATGQERFGRRPGDAAARGEGVFVLPPDLGVRDPAVNHRHGGAFVPEDGHDRLDPGTSFGELGSQGVAEPVCADGRVTVAVDEPGSGARGLERFVEQRGGGDEFALADENVVREASAGGVAAGCRLLGPGLVDELLESGGGVRMQRNHAFAVAFADRDTEPGVAAGVAVEAVAGEPSDLVTPGTGPPQQQQRCPLHGVVELVDGLHERIELMLGQVAGDCLGATGCVSAGQEWSAGDVVPAPDRGVAAERADRVDFVLAGGGLERMPGLLAAVGRQPAQILLDQGPIELGQARDLCVVGGQPADQATESFPGQAHRLGAVELRLQPGP